MLESSALTYPKNRTSFLTTNQRKLLKKVQLHVRSFAQSRGR